MGHLEIICVIPIGKGYDLGLNRIPVFISVKLALTLRSDPDVIC